MTRSRHATYLTGAILLATAAVMTAWPEQTATRQPDPTRRMVQTAPLERAESTRQVRLPGVTRAVHRAHLAFSVPARLVERPVEVGDRVAEGALLARLDQREFSLGERAAAAAADELDARLAQARRDLERVQRLAVAKAATAEELEQVQAAVDALEASHAAAVARARDARRRLDETALRAPFAGTVVAVHLEPGEWAAPGAPVLQLAGSGPVEVVVEAPEAVRGGLRAGDPVQVELTAVGRTVGGRITAVAAAAGLGGLFPVEVRLGDADDVVAGQAAEVRLELATEAALTAPLQAVVNPGSTQPTVFVIADGVARKVPVELGRVVGDRVVVRGELDQGDVVAVSGHTALAEGDGVEVLS